MSTAENSVAAPEVSSTRAYRSPRRRLQADQTRAAILEAARDLFATRGWVGTSVRDIARTADVSIETVYATVGAKAAVLKAALDFSIAGDDEPIPIAERPGFAAIRRGATLRDRARAAARVTGETNERAAQLEPALRQGALVDRELADLLAEYEDGRRRDIVLGGELVVGRELTQTEFDELWTLTSIPVTVMLVRDCGWGQDAFQEWLTDRIEELFTRAT
ncbi:TetR/AcrR family transcriptional regulator [Aldersonia kunmingensis]|uniref:TetR/AcrR family transcriptional regulator n=1 Tax=Aldersonia kunmingensis TaxID=408066 RepID=UPI000835ED8D|nr:helix-turn-helix domain-containing protein [Aldersonia kunmingensis]